MADLSGIVSGILPPGPTSGSSDSANPSSASATPSGSASASASASAPTSDPGPSNSASAPTSASQPASESSAPPPSSTPPPSSSAPPTSASAILSTGQSTFLSTNSNGQITTITSEVTQTISGASAGNTNTSKNNNDTSNSHAGAIAGGVVGGVAGLLILAVLIWFIRRRARERALDAEFDGNFDPGRTTGGPTLPRMSGDAGAVGPNGLRAEDDDDGVGGRLAGSSIGGGVVTPFMAGVGAGASMGHPQQHAYYPDPYHQQQQQGYYAGGYDAGSEGGQGPSPTMSSYYGGSSSTHPINAGPAMSTAGSSSGAYTNPMSAKEREARGGSMYSVANPGPTPGPMSMPPMPDASSMQLPNPHSPGDVVVHQDGGRVPQPEEQEGMREIPPTYDSIRS